MHKTPQCHTGLGTAVVPAIRSDETEEPADRNVRSHQLVVTVGRSRRGVGAGVDANASSPATKATADSRTNTVE